MTAVPPPAPPPLPLATGPATAAAVEAVPTMPLSPELVAKLLAARQLAALVLAVGPHNTVSLRTDAATLTVRLPFPIQPGTQLLLQVGPPATADAGQPRLMVSGGRLPTPAPPPRGAAVTLPPSMATSGQPPAPPTAIATVLHSDPAGAVALPPGTSFPVRVVSVAATMPQPGPAASMPPSAAAPPLPPVPVSQPPGPVPGGAPPPPMPSPVVVSPPATPVLADTSPVLADAPPALPPHIVGVVRPNSHAGQPLVQTPAGLVALGGGISLPSGASVVLEIAGPPVAAPLPSPGAAARGTPWSGLGEALQVLRQADPGAAERLAMALPQPGPRLAAGLMLAAAALQADSVRVLVGDAVLQGLERVGRRDLVKRVTEEMIEAAAPSRSSTGEWRTLTLPLLSHAAIEPIRLYMRRPESDYGDDGGRSGEGGGDGGRFLVDVTLSRLGRLQLDGLVQRPAKRFEMILRSERSLPDEVRNDIVGIFTGCCESLGLTGGILFHAGQPFVEPQGNSAPLARDGLLV